MDLEESGHRPQRRQVERIGRRIQIIRCEKPAHQVVFRARVRSATPRRFPCGCIEPFYNVEEDLSVSTGFIDNLELSLCSVAFLLTSYLDLPEADTRLPRGSLLVRSMPCPLQDPLIQPANSSAWRRQTEARPLVRAIVTDIVRSFQTVDELRQRLSAIAHRGARKPSADDPYAEELAQTRGELENEETRLREFIDELEKLGVELKGPDGLCDFPSMIEGRPVYLCWRLGEPQVSYWHELNTGFSGRQPLDKFMSKRPIEPCSS